MSVMKPALFPAIPDVEAEDYYIDADKLISGNPKQTLWLEYTDDSGRYSSGVWASEVGEWRVSFSEEEYCRIIEGVSIITNTEGEAFTVKPGDEFVMPAGFKGTWKVVEPTKKRFVVYEKA